MINTSGDWISDKYNNDKEWASLYLWPMSNRDYRMDKSYYFPISSTIFCVHFSSHLVVRCFQIDLCYSHSISNICNSIENLAMCNSFINVLISCLIQINPYLNEPMTILVKVVTRDINLYFLCVTWMVELSFLVIVELMIV